MPIDAPFVLAPVAGTGLEGLTFGSLNLNNQNGPYALEALDMTPPPKKPEWAQSADGDGQALVRTPLFDNRKITMQLRVEGQGTMDLALTAVGNLVDQIQEAEKQPGGVALTWTPAGGTRSITFYVLTGTVTGVPISVTQAAGWFVNRPVITVELTCKPFGYGTEVAGTSVASGANPTVTLTVANVAGDVPAEGRLVVTDTAAIARQYVEWGLEQRYYNASAGLTILATAMPLASGAGATRTGSYSSNVLRYTVGVANTPVASGYTPTPALHIGSYRVRARTYLNAATGMMRLQYRDGNGPLRPNAWASPTVINAWGDMDLGIINITPALAGTQSWVGQIDVQGTAGGEVADLDFLLLFPVTEGYGKARGVPSDPAIWSAQSIEMRSAATIRLSGGIYAPPAVYRGSRFFVPPAGSANRTSRIFVRATSADVETIGGYPGAADPFSVQAFVTPRFHVVPR